MPTQRLREVPTKFLVAKVLPGTSVVADTIVDEAHPYFGYPTSFTVDVYVDIQTHSSQNTRAPFIYDIYDVNVGDWLAQPAGKTYKIVEILQIADENHATIKISDENLYNLESDPSQTGNNYPDEDQACAIFELDEDGNPIIAGVTNQSGQFPGLTYWVEDIKSRFEYYSIDEDGVETIADLDQTIDTISYPLGTNGDYSPTGVKIEFTPYHDSRVDVKVNGISVNLGNGIRTKDCYFSNDNGDSARLIQDITAGDELFWNGGISRYELDERDDIDFIYEASSLDV